LDLHIRASTVNEVRTLFVYLRDVAERKRLVEGMENDEEVAPKREPAGDDCKVLRSSSRHADQRAVDRLPSVPVIKFGIRELGTNIRLYMAARKGDKGPPILPRKGNSPCPRPSSQNWHALP
jgi:hypothetical protein